MPTNALKTASLALTLLASVLLCGCGGGENEPFIPHSYPPPGIIAFQLHYQAPSTPGEPSKLSLHTVGQNFVIASTGVATVELVLTGHDPQLLTQASLDPSTAKPYYEFEIPADFTLGAYSCHDGLSMVRVTSNYGSVLTQSFELCPGPSVDFAPASRDV